MAYSHSNRLVENTIGRARVLVGNLMFAMSEKTGIQFLQTVRGGVRR